MRISIASKEILGNVNEWASTICDARRDSPATKNLVSRTSIARVLSCGKGLISHAQAIARLYFCKPEVSRVIHQEGWVTR